MSGMRSTMVRSCAAALLTLAVSTYAAAPTAAVNASPSSGRAPLGVLFDASSSSPDALTFLWEFGDGATSTAKSVTHVYTVAGTYVAALTVANAAGETGSSQITITVTGNSEGTLTPDMNFRWAITSASFSLKHKQVNRDALTMTATFNTVDLPTRLDGLAASFSINGVFTATGVLTAGGTFQNPEHFTKPSYVIEISPANQMLSVYITRAQLKDALALSGATDATVPRPGLQVPVTFTLTVGAQTYSITEYFAYTSTAGGSGRGVFDLKKHTGTVADGSFVISQAAALENSDGTGHFFQFDGYLVRPLGIPLQVPGAGGFTFKLNDADRQIVLFDRLRLRDSKITYQQVDRGLGGIRSLVFDLITGRFTIKTWDMLADTTEGGTGLPLRGQPFLAFNFALRLDFDQTATSSLQAVTATQLQRKTRDDTFWQTGRKKK